MAFYQVKIYTPSQELLFVAEDFLALDYSRRVNAPGSLSLTLPNDYDYRFFPRDTVIEVWRANDIGGWYLDLDSMWLVQKVRRQLTRAGERLLTLEAEDILSFIGRRIVAYFAGTGQADKSDYADNLLKAIIRENFGSSALSARQLTGVMIDDDISRAAPGIAKAFAWRNALTVLQELSGTSIANEYYLAFDFVGRAPTFRTFNNQRGVDRSRRAANPQVLSPNVGNLTDIDRLDDFSQLYNYVYMLGQGTGASRYVIEVKNNDTLNLSKWARTEKTYDVRNVANVTGLEGEGEAMLRDGRVRKTLKGQFQETEACMWGRDIGFGDRVVAEFDGEIFDAYISAVRTTLNKGLETIDVRIETDAAAAVSIPFSPPAPGGST